MSVRVDWPLLRSTLERARAAWKEIPPSALGNFDQLLAGVRDKLDEFGLTIGDPEVVYSGIVFAALLNALGEVARDQGLVTAQSADDVGQVTALLTLLLADHAPEEARR